MNASVKKYLEYTSDVLGIRHLFFSEPKTQIKLLILVDDLETYTPAEDDLLQKMITALGMNSETYSVCSSSIVDKPTADFLLLLADNILEDKEKIIQTYSPRVLLQDSNLKKQAWSDMQRLLQSIRQNIK